MSLIVGIVLPQFILAGIMLFVKKLKITVRNVLLYILSKMIIFTGLIFLFKDIIFVDFKSFILGLGIGSLLMFGILMVFIQYIKKERGLGNGNHR